MHISPSRRNKGQHELLVLDASAPMGARAPACGELFRNPTLAATMRELAAGGKDSFYKGRAGRSICEYLHALGSVMTQEDLANHCDRGSTFEEPISVNYHGVDVYEHAPNGQGIAGCIDKKF